MIVRSGLALSIPVLFSTGHPDGNVSWRLFGATGGEIASGSVAVPIDALSINLPIAAEHNTLPGAALFGSRDFSWTYTVGAFESWDQPELLMVDMDAEVQKTLVQAVADDYVVFGELREDTPAMLDVEIVVVDESHLRDGLVAQWEDRYSISAFTGDFVQIVPGASWARGGRGAPIRRLDDAE